MSVTHCYRAEVIGSLLRPEYLKAARKQLAAGEITPREFKRLEDRGAVDEARSRCRKRAVSRS